MGGILICLHEKCFFVMHDKVTTIIENQKLGSKISDLNYSIIVAKIINNYIIVIAIDFFLGGGGLFSCLCCCGRTYPLWNV